MKEYFFILAVLAFFSQVDGFKVLGVLPFGSNSHFAVGNSILKALHKAGHEVTVISPFPQKKPMENFREINTAEVLENQQKGKNEARSD